MAVRAFCHQDMALCLKKRTYCISASSSSSNLSTGIYMQTSLLTPRDALPPQSHRTTCREITSILSISQPKCIIINIDATLSPTPPNDKKSDETGRYEKGMGNLLLLIPPLRLSHCLRSKDKQRQSAHACMMYKAHTSADRGTPCLPRADIHTHHMDAFVALPSLRSGICEIRKPEE